VYSAPLHEKTKWLSGFERWGVCPADWPESIDHPDMPPAIPSQFRADSRLMVITCGWNYGAALINHPDVYYLLWEGDHFRELRHIKPPPAQRTR
jgi:hypothetical protein